MPSAYGNTVQHWRSQVVADITSQTADKCTVRSRCYWHSISWGYNVSGVKGHASVGSYGSGDKTFTASSGTGASVSKLVATVTHTYTRTNSDQKITCKFRYEAKQKPQQFAQPRDISIINIFEKKASSDKIGK